MNWDAEIWAPCRLGEAFTLRDLGRERTEYLYAIKADWMNHHGDAMCVWRPEEMDKPIPHVDCLGAGPRPWANCWTYEAAIKITPPVWCWDMQEDTMFGLDLKPKRNGKRRKMKLDYVMFRQGRAVYRMLVEYSDGNQHQYYESIPVLDPYFAPIWPATAEETPEVEEPAPKPVADPVAETVTNTPEPEQTGPEAEQTPENAEQTADSEESASVAILPSAAKWPERDTTADVTAAAVYAVGGIINTPGVELEADPGELIVPTDQLRRILTTSNAADLTAHFLEQPLAGDNAPASWTGTENRPPGACIGGRLPISGRYYYYVWHEDQPTEGENHE